ncbi:LNS2-domain-containing protein [Microstroma glucosiphilum]|uniref:phosphatidate phosphatase n=1 Tax=Pseudomicrostroma glucosiphilum TaxID=1684307 RepID=A0A316UEL6_9BASI|nr:LNS2-domain-containing protein [Pseudomicrostroma glucosiphilum]PWN21545.1 LNS2-domain-containing protein [Pseudomicrostroma glucosiphilum]
MQYVGRFVSSVYNTITPNINPATLSGAIDVIVVEREVEVEEDDPQDDTQDGTALSEGGEKREKRKRKRWTTELASTPFHVRFGKMSVLRPGERKVTLHLNNSTEPLPFAMKVGEQGEAFFVVEIDEEENAIPDDLVTSPILSASASPLASPGLEGADAPGGSGQAAGISSDNGIGSNYVEPLDLDDSRTATAAAVGAGGSASPALDLEEAQESDADARSAAMTVATNTTDDTGITSPNSSRSPSTDKEGLAEYKPSGRPDSPDLDVPSDSGLNGSGPAAGSSSLLGHLGHAASRAGGAIGAASRAVGVSASANPRLDKLARRSSRRSLGGETGAPVDEEKGDAHEYDPGFDTSEQEEKQRAGDETAAQSRDAPSSETEKLEQKMMNQTDELIKAEENLLESAHKGHSQGNDEENRRSSLASQASLSGEESYPAPFGSRADSKEIAATRSPVRSGSNTYPVSQADHSQYLAGRRVSGIAPVDEIGISPTHLDPRPIERQIRSFKEAARSHDALAEATGSGSGSVEPVKVEEAVAQEAVSKKSVTSRTKEDLQYMLDMDGYKMTTDGEDLAFAEGHRLADELPLSRRHGGHERHPHIGEYLDTAHRREGIAHDTHRDSEGGPSSSSAAGAGNGLDPLMSLGTDTPTLASHGANNNQEDIEFSRDLATVARALLPPDHEADSLDVPEELQKMKRRGHRSSGTVHQDGSHSDTDLDDVNEDGNAVASTVSGLRNKSHLRAKSGPFDYSLGRMLPGDATPPAHYEESPKSGAWSMDRSGSAIPRHRVLSSGAEDGLSNSRSEALGLLRQRSNGPRFRGYEGDPYTFELVLEDGCERHFAMSLCFKEGFGATSSPSQQGDGSAPAEENAGSEEDRDDFEENRISFQRFVEDPDVVNDERLVVLYNDRYLTWENASAVLATLSLYRKTFASAKAAEEEAVLTDEPVPSREHRASVWSRWWNRNRHLEGGEVDRDLRESSAPPEDHPATQPAAAGPAVGEAGAPHLERTQSDPTLLSGAQQNQPPRPHQSAKGGPQKTYAKTLRLTSDQLKSLNLKKGANNITFSVTSSYSGVATCTARIFLWESKHHIVVSDIDGTITKSDALGHVFTMIGRDWTHLGVAKLYTDIARNGYRIMYLTSRAIGQADTTRDYLRGINQNNYRLPDGPVIMSPDRLIASLHREVILRKPEVFKMACLRDIARLFGADPRHAQPQPGGNLPGVTTEALKDAARKEVEPTSSSGSVTAANTSSANPTPFYAGFGNRITDALSYRSVNIPSSRIFTIDTNGEVKMELLELAGYKSSYIHMTDLVDQMFPPITQRSSVRNAGKPEFSDFNYWRPSVGEFELPSDEDLMPTPPVSPALSARSGRSVRSTASVRSGGGVAGSSSTADADPQQSQGRLSRFGLGSLGLSRKGSIQTIAEPASSDASSKKSSDGAAGPAGMIESASAPDLQNPERSASNTLTDSAEGDGSAGGNRWISSPWRRRAASPGAVGGSVMGTAAGMSSPPQATSPLVGPVITADDPDTDEEEDDDDEEESGEEYEEYEENDDVSSFGSQDEGGSQSGSGSGSGSGSEDEEDEPGAAGAASGAEGSGESSGARRATRGRRGRSAGAGGQAGDASAQGGRGEPMESPLEDDELLATGEVQFDWRG